jgi:hypothetical protein
MKNIMWAFHGGASDAGTPHCRDEWRAYVPSAELVQCWVGYIVVENHMLVVWDRLPNDGPRKDRWEWSRRGALPDATIEECKRALEMILMFTEHQFDEELPHIDVGNPPPVGHR